MSELLQLQFLFARLSQRLYAHINTVGLEFTYGETWRTPEQDAWNVAHGLGIGNSLHTERLAVDLNLFSPDGTLLGADAHRPIGEWWRQQNPLCRWGGNFSKPDPDHYSITYQGRA